MFHLYFLLSLSVESAKFCKSCTVPALFKVHQKVLNALSKVLGLTWVQCSFVAMKSSAIQWSPFVVAQKAGANSNCQPGCMPASTFESLCSNQLFWILLLHVECAYICLYKFLYVMSFDFRMPGCLTRCGDTLWEKSESHGDPKPERKGDLAASEVWIFWAQMFSKKCEIGNAWKNTERDWNRCTFCHVVLFSIWTWR